MPLHHSCGTIVQREPCSGAAIIKDKFACSGIDVDRLHHCQIDGLRAIAGAKTGLNPTLVQTDAAERCGAIEPGIINRGRVDLLAFEWKAERDIRASASYPQPDLTGAMRTGSGRDETQDSKMEDAILINTPAGCAVKNPIDETELPLECQRGIPSRNEGLAIDFQRDLNRTRCRKAHVRTRSESGEAFMIMDRVGDVSIGKDRCMIPR
ncbi:MAG: hypothetical protein U1D66_00960 [Erythrobacter sp.]|nr:hypothetical protein [Erythrobacter sp.]